MHRAMQIRRARLAAFAAQVATGVSSKNETALQISGVQAYPLREPVSGRAYTVIRAQTQSGMTGYGECARVSPTELAVARRIIIGNEATAFVALGQRLGAIPNIRAAIDMALLDLAGKRTRAPVYQILGGPTRNKVRAMAALAGSTDRELVASMEHARASGFRAFRVPVIAPAAANQGQAFVHAVRRRLETLRGAAGEDADFVLDAAGELTPGDAASLSRALEHFRLLWLDEPSKISSLAAVQKLAAESVTPVGFGRNITRAGDFQDLLREDAIDILRPDLSLNGVTQIRKMAALAETYYVAVAPFHDGGPLATAAALHLAASLPNFFIQQIPLPKSDQDRRMRQELTGGSIEKISDGFAALPTGPGLGVTIREEALEKYKERAA